MSESTCVQGDGKPVFAKKLCRTHYTDDLNARRAEGKKITRGPERQTSDDAPCAHCGKIIKLRRERLEAFKAGRPIYCGRACQVANGRVETECEGCGELISVIVRGKRGLAERRFCSLKCMNQHGAKPRKGNTASCGVCGIPVYRRTSAQWPTVFCSAACRAKGVGPTLRRKPGERYVNRHGYAFITDEQGRCRSEHRVVMEGIIGRPLWTDETVHHRAGGFLGRSDNRPENLELWSGPHPKGHRVLDMVENSRRVLGLYGTEAEQATYAASARD